MPKWEIDNTQIHECSFQAHVSHAFAPVKFSCSIFVAWKSMSNKTFCRTSHENKPLKDGVANFDETLNFQTYLYYDKSLGKYTKKQTFLSLMLISARKPDEEKMVGRVVVDLGQVINDLKFNEVQNHALAFCSIKESTVSFSIKVLGCAKTSLRPLNVDMDEYSIIEAPIQAPAESNVQTPMEEPAQAQIEAPMEAPVEVPEATVEPSPGPREQHADLEYAAEKEVTTPKELPELLEAADNANNNLGGEDFSYRVIEVNDPDNDSEAGDPVPLEKAPDDSFNQPRQPNQSLQNKEIPERLQFVPQPQESARQQAPGQPCITNQIEVIEAVHLQAISDHKEYIHKATQQVSRLQQQQAHPSQSVQEIIEKAEINQPKLQLQKENQRLIQIITEKDQILNQQKAEAQRWKILYHTLEQNSVKYLSEKEEVINELLSQAQESSRRLTENEQSLRNNSSFEGDITRFKHKLRKAIRKIEESEKRRLQNEAELLEVKYELAQLKAEKEAILLEGKAKEDEIEKLNKLIEELKNTKVYEQIEKSSLYRSYSMMSMMSDKERENYNQQIEALRRKVNKLATDLQFTEQVKQNLMKFGHVCQQLNHEKEHLLNELNFIKEQKQYLINSVSPQKEVDNEKRLYRRIQYLEQSLKAVESELNRSYAERDRLESKVRDLQGKNQLVQNLQADDTISPTNQQQNIQAATLKAPDAIQEKIQTISTLNNVISHTATMQLEKQLQNYKSEIKILKIQLQDINRLLKQRESQIEELQVHNKRLASKSQEQQKNDEALQKERLSFQSRCEELTRNLQRAERECHRLQSELSVFQKQAGGQEQLIQQLRQSVSILQTQNIKQKQRVSEFAQLDSPAKNKAEQQLSRVAQSLRSKERQIELLNEKVQSDAVRILEFEERISKFAEKQLKMKENILILQEQSKKIYNIVLEKEKQQQLQFEMLQQKEAEIQNLRAHLNSLSRSPAQNRSPEQQDLNIKMFDAEGSGAKIYQPDSSFPNRRFAELQAQIQAQSRAINQLTNKNKLLQNQHEALRVKALDLEKRNSELTSRLLSSAKTSSNQQLKTTLTKNKTQFSTDSGIKRQSGPETDEARIRLLTHQNEMMEAQLVAQEHKISQLTGELQRANKNIRHMKNQLEDDSQFQKMSVELDKHFKQKSQNHLDEIKKSRMLSSVGLSDIVEACRSLQTVLKQRSQKDKTEVIIQLMANKNALLEEQFSRITVERGMVQQNARRLSMEFQKIKAKILKTKGNFQQRDELLSTLKPCEIKVKDLVQISQKLFEEEAQLENF